MLKNRPYQELDRTLARLHALPVSSKKSRPRQTAWLSVVDEPLKMLGGYGSDDDADDDFLGLPSVPPYAPSG